MYEVENVWYLKDLQAEKNKQPVLEFNNFLNEQEINFIKNEVDRDAKHGEVWDSKTQSFIVVKDIRNSPVSWLSPNNKKYENIFRKLTDIINEINFIHYNYNLTFIEALQYTKYIGSDESPGFYGEHTDSNSFRTGYLDRKLSFSIQLSHPNEYDGGDLITYNYRKEPYTATKEKGLITFFPSGTLHEVTPVTRGERISLVGWINGPEFT
jgi:PKHD-type hydroxylase